MVFLFSGWKENKEDRCYARMTGYYEFVDMLKKKGFPAQSPGAFHFEQKAVRDILHEVFGEEFGKDNGMGK